MAARKLKLLRINKVRLVNSLIDKLSLALALKGLLALLLMKERKTEGRNCSEMATEDETATELKPSRCSRESMMIINSLKPSKLCFSSQSERDPQIRFRNKYSWFRHVIGQGEDARPVWVKALNLARMKRLIMMRKLMNTNFLNSNNCALPDKKAIGCGWFRDLQQLKSKSTIKDKYLPLQAIRRLRKTIARKRKLAHPPPKETQRESEKPFCEMTDAMDFPDPSDFSHRLNSDERRHAPFETPLEAGHKKNYFRSMVQTKFRKLHLRSAIPHPQVSQEKRLKEMQQMAFSDEAFEVLVNSKLAELDPKKRVNKASLYQVYAITLRQAVYRHDWALVSKSCEGLCQEVHKRLHEKTSRFWCLWNGGLLGLVNIYKDDPSILIKSARWMRYALQAYPRRIGIDLATWLTQKGHFSQGVAELEEMHQSLSKIHTWRGRPCYQNPKRSTIDFVAELFTATNQYAIYKQKKRLAELDGSGDGEDASELFEVGRFVLNLFEILEKRGEEFECDSTILIEPLIELTLGVYGREAAKETFGRILKKNYQHGVLSELYLEFLQEHFPDATDQIEREKIKMEQFDFSISKYDSKIAKAKFSRFLKRLPAVSSFTQIPNPSFSW